MKMVRAVIRPEKTEEVAAALDKAGYSSMTKFHVFGRGKQGGLHVGSVHYDELSKVLLMLVVEDGEADEVMEIITEWGRTGNMGDGKIFVTQVDEVHTIRTGEVQL